MNEIGGSKTHPTLLSDELFSSPLDLNPLVPPVVSEMVMQCVATNIRRRPADMDAMLMKLEIGKHLVVRARDPNSIKIATSDINDDSHVGIPPPKM